MEVKILHEAGYEYAVRGVGLSFGVEDFERLKGVATKLCNKDGGHNKFLESMQVWISLRAARYFWAEFDTYRVGTTKQSESTVHTICRTHLCQDDFEHEILPATIKHMNALIKQYNEAEVPADKRHFFGLIKANLPEGFLQTRIVCTNYKALRNMIWQRRNHKLFEWHYFIAALRDNLQYSEILFKGWDK